MDSAPNQSHGQPSSKSTAAMLRQTRTGPTAAAAASTPLTVPTGDSARVGEEGAAAPPPSSTLPAARGRSREADTTHRGSTAAQDPSPTGPGGIPLPPSTVLNGAAHVGILSSKEEESDEAAPMLSNASMALAEFTSLLRPAENKGYLKEHIISLLHGVDKEDTLVRLATELERNARPRANTTTTTVTHTDSNDGDGISSRLSPVTTVSESTAAMGSSHNRGVEGFGNFSFHYNRSLRRPRGSSSASASVPVNIQESILKSHLDHQSARQQHQLSAMGRGSQRPSVVSFTTDGSDGAASSAAPDDPTGAATTPARRRGRHRRRSLLGAAALGLNLFQTALDASSRTTNTDEPASDGRRDRQARHQAGRRDKGDSGDEEDDPDKDGEAACSLASSATAGRDAGMVDPLDVPGATPAIPEVVRKEGRRVAVSAAPFALGEVREYAPKVIPKTPAEMRQLRDVVKACHLFAGLEERDVEEVVLAMARETFAAGASVLEQGQDTRDCLFLLTEGSCEAIKNGKVIGGLSAGGIFGELELMYKQAKCAATIRCITRCVIYTLDEESYRHAVVTGALQKRKKYEELTMQAPFLKGLPNYERMKIAEALVTKQFKRGQYVIRFGAKGTHLHFIVEGDVKVVGRNQGKKVEVVRLHVGDVVGELEFLFNHLTVADVVVTSRRLVTACISRHHFEMILGAIQDRLKEFVATSSTYEAYYIKEVANANVRSELSRAGDVSQRKNRRRVASSTTEGGGTAAASGGSGEAVGEGMSLKNVDPRGEIILPAKRSLLHHFTTADLLDDKEKLNTATNNPSAAAGAIAASQLGETLAGAGVGDDPLLFRFPFSSLNAERHMLILGLREDGVVLSWNDAMAKLTSYPAEEVVGQNIYSFLLESHDQQVMFQAITDARNYAGDIDGFCADGSLGKSRKYTFARSDGLTRAVVRLSIIPPLVSAGENGADMLLAFGEEVKQSPHQIVDQSQWLSSQIRAILADGTHTYEDRLQLVADAANSYEATYRALTMSTEKLRVVNIRQMLGQVMMDFGAECVSKGLGVRQRFEGLTTERAYLDAELLPECLRFATSACIAVPEITQLLITVTLMEKNGLEFLVINFKVDGQGFSPDCVPILEMPLNELSHQLQGDNDSDKSKSTTPAAVNSVAGSIGGGGDGGVGDVDLMSEKRKDKRRLTHAQRQQLRRVREVVEEQGGTMRVQRNEEDSNLFFLIPFIPAGAEEAENASVAESISNVHNLSMSTLYAGQPAGESMTAAAKAAGGGASSSDGASAGNIFLAAADASGGDAPLISEHTTPQLAYNFTTLVAEDTPAHRNMLCSYLWERRHAVLPAYSLADIDRLTGVADILFIDLHQSIISSLTSQDPIALLREKARHMAIVVTAKNFDGVSVDPYHAAGFITLKKPCTPVQAMQAIHKAEEKIFAHKQEAERIAQARETLARNSRGAWTRGKLLGKGSFGEVFEAVDVLTGGKMAVKEMHLGKDNKRIEMFVEEVATMCNLQHPNIIHYFYCEQSSDLNAIRVFMEFAAGGTLQGLLSQRGKLPFKEFQSLLRDVTEGLAYIHSQRYVHCDIKTANVLLSREGMGKIGDFGTARTLREGEQLYEMQGSPLYMSPECMSAGDLDEDGQRIGYSFATDVWSLGCVALEMATNKPPFAHIKRFNGPAGFTNFITSLTDTPDLSPLFGGPPSVVEFVSACLNPDPARRPTAHQLLQMSVFSETTDENTKSAVQALRRAQLLHVLNKFIAFEEPDKADARLGKDLKYKTYKRDYCDYFQSSRSGSEEADEGAADAAGSPAAGRRVTSRAGRHSSNDGSSGSSSSDSDEAMMVAVELPRARHEEGEIIRDGNAGGAARRPLSSNAPPATGDGDGGGGTASGRPRWRAAGLLITIPPSSSSSSAAVASPSPERLPSTAADGDASPTPKKRSKTLSKPPPPQMRMASPMRRMAVVDSDDDAAEDAFFDSSATSSPGSPFSSASSAKAAATAPSAPPAADPPLVEVDPPSTHTSTPMTPQPISRADPAHGTTDASDRPRSPLPRRQATSSTSVKGNESASDRAGKPHPQHLSASGSGGVRRPALWKREGTSQPQQHLHRAGGVSNVSFAPLLAASFIGRVAAVAAASVSGAAGVTGGGGGGNAPSSVADATHTDFNGTDHSMGSAVSAALASVAAQPLSAANLNRNLSFVNNNTSFMKNVSFMGANMDEVLNNAANDVMLNLASGPAGERPHKYRAVSAPSTSSAPLATPTDLAGSEPLPHRTQEASSVPAAGPPPRSQLGAESSARDATAATSAEATAGERSSGSRASPPPSAARESDGQPIGTHTEDAVDLTDSGSPFLQSGVAGSASSFTAAAGAAAPAVAGEATVMATGGRGAYRGRQPPERSPSPLPGIPSSVATAPAAHVLDRVEGVHRVDSIRGFPRSSSASSTSTGSPESTNSASVSDGGGRQPRTHLLFRGDGIDDPNDVRLKIARKLRKAHTALNNRSFFRIEERAGPLGNSMNTTSSHLTSLLGNLREGSQGGISLYRPFNRSRTASGEGHGQAEDSAPAPQHSPHQQQPQLSRVSDELNVKQRGPASESPAAGVANPPAVSSALLAAVLRPLAHMSSLARASPDTPLSHGSDGGGGSDAVGSPRATAVVAPQYVANRWLDSTVLAHPTLGHLSSDDEGFSVPSLQLYSAISADSRRASSAPRTPASFPVAGRDSGGGADEDESIAGDLPAAAAAAAPRRVSASNHFFNTGTSFAHPSFVSFPSPALPAPPHDSRTSVSAGEVATALGSRDLAMVESALHDIAGHLKRLIAASAAAGKERSALRGPVRVLPHPAVLGNSTSSLTPTTGTATSSCAGSTTLHSGSAHPLADEPFDAPPGSPRRRSDSAADSTRSSVSSVSSGSPASFALTGRPPTVPIPVETSGLRPASTPTTTTTTTTTTTMTNSSGGRSLSRHADTAVGVSDPGTSQDQPGGRMPAADRPTAPPSLLPSLQAEGLHPSAVAQTLLQKVNALSSMVGSLRAGASHGSGESHSSHHQVGAN